MSLSNLLHQTSFLVLCYMCFKSTNKHCLCFSQIISRIRSLPALSTSTTVQDTVIFLTWATAKLTSYLLPPAGITAALRAHGYFPSLRHALETVRKLVPCCDLVTSLLLYMLQMYHCPKVLARALSLFLKHFSLGYLLSKATAAEMFPSVTLSCTSTTPPASKLLTQGAFLFAPT